MKKPKVKKKKPEPRSIDIRPDTGVYATFRRISYHPWSAIAEFVDNATQNYFDHKEDIAKRTGRTPKLDIDIAYDSKAKTLAIVDNANGMNWSELERAIQLNRPPENTSGRSEFGMGLKMAACWFGSRWRVVTKRLGDEIEYNAFVDVNSLETEKPQAITVTQSFGLEPLNHYTRVEIENLHRTFRGRALSSVRENIASMYRRDIESGDIAIKWNGEPFAWEPDCPFEETLSDGTVNRWEKNVQFNVSGLDVTGRVWIRIPGEARRAGMHLFRRDRLVVGGPGNGYKPAEIFGAPNQYPSQRLFGELDLNHWPVTQTKDAFDWVGDLENEFVKKLHSEVAEYVEKLAHPTSEPGPKTTSADGQVAGDNTKDSLQGPEFDSAMTIVETGPPPPQQLSTVAEQRLQQAIEQFGDQPTYVQIGTEGVPTLKVYWLEDLADTDVHAHFEMPSSDELLLYVNLNHPFVDRVIGREPAKLDLYALNLYADALVESGIRKRGQNVPAHTFRRFKDAFLRVINSRSS
ncbi:MAG: ATP-binding protein [Chloroflexi bacterium]|nr:ATP-binding protein [Chloroflexota bacterium]